MADLEKLKRNLEERGFSVSCFDTAEEAAAYLDAALDQKTIGIGGSVTIQEMGLAERLGTHNRILSHWTGGTQEEAAGQVGKSRSALANSLRLLSLQPDILELVSQGKLTAGHARAVLTV